MDALLGDEPRGTKISEDNPVPDFKRILGTSEQVSEIEDAAKQMGGIIRTLITDSFGDSKYDQAMECLGVLREELINLEEPGLYNTFIKDVKKNMLSGAYGGDRRDFWFQIRGAKMGLIDTRQSEVSDVLPEAADEVSSCPVPPLISAFISMLHD